MKGFVVLRLVRMGRMGCGENTQTNHQDKDLNLPGKLIQMVGRIKMVEKSKVRLQKDSFGWRYALRECFVPVSCCTVS